MSFSYGCPLYDAHEYAPLECTKRINDGLSCCVFSQAWKKLRDTVKRVHAQREPSFDMEFAKAYHMIATSEEVNVAMIEKIYEDATALALREWRSLPDIVSHSHIPILEASLTDLTVFGLKSSARVVNQFFKYWLCLLAYSLSRTYASIRCSRAGGAEVC